MLSLLEILRRTTDHLKARGVESPRLNAELLLGHALGLPRMQLYLQFERPLTEEELSAIRPLVRRRAAREPLQYIVGAVDFHGISLRVDRRALIPRPETEHLVELAVAEGTTPPARILDLGTGSGAIALALARHFSEAVVTAVDLSAEALALAAENADQLGLANQVRLVQSDWFDALPPAETFNLIVGNPPYLSAAETAATAPEVREFEPARALTSGGTEGRADLERIIRAALPHLDPGGRLMLETGPEQHPALLGCAREAGFGEVSSRKDLTGRDRYLVAIR